MSNDQYTSDTEYDMFSPCPGCGNIGFSVQVFEETRDGKIQLMRCPEPFTECRTAEYYPRSVDADINQNGDSE